MEAAFFLTLADALLIHRNQIENYGGAGGIRDLDLLQSALAMPDASFHGERLHLDLFEMAAAYAFHICQNHPFVDGNKRAALACALVFLEINGVLPDDPEGRLYQMMIDVASGHSTKADIARLFGELALHTGKG